MMLSDIINQLQVIVRILNFETQLKSYCLVWLQINMNSIQMGGTKKTFQISIDFAEIKKKHNDHWPCLAQISPNR